MTLGGRGAGRNGVTEFPQAATQTIDPGRSGRFPLLPHTVQLLDLLLLDRAHRNRINPPAAVGIDQRLGIGSIGFVPESILSDELCGKHDGLVTKRCGFPGPEMGTATGFQQHDGTVSLGHESLELAASEPQVGVRLSTRAGDGDLEDVLCEIDGDEITLVHGLLLSWDIQRFTSRMLAHCDAEKTREESISSLKFVPRFALHRTRLTPRRLA
jgi:hypothetical protein